MAITFAKPLLSIGHCWGSSHQDYPLPVLPASAVSCRPKSINIALVIGPRCLQLKSKISDFSCFSLPCHSQRVVAIAKGLYSPSAADSPEGELDSDISGKPEPFLSFTQENCDNEVCELIQSVEFNLGAPPLSREKNNVT
ncbi:uncharacterized protein LOC131038052 [Cryptomeria japonica]|uniref:uncharacterized protein LOC131038052 n=1 Tax=Cryptomeria japonica TaxID=3369 RepID=UPI0027DA9605|nr:uncharacterized protein LOC131038052 [Cryptomeria japonica]